MNPPIKGAVSERATRYRATGGAPSAMRWEYWDCRFNKKERALLIAAIAMAAALHLSPVLHSGLGTVLTYAFPAVSYLNPVTGFFFIACSQFVPFPEGSRHNPAQAGVLVWIPMALLAYRRVNLQGLWRLWPVLPWLCWHMLLTGEKIYMPNTDYFKALVYCVIACQLANEARGRFLKCLLGLCLGALLVMTAYWASQLGLPVEVNDWGVDREGISRMGGVRADAVMVWPALLFGIAGLLGTQITFASRGSPKPSPAWLTYGTVVLSVASLPPLISTMCHGAIAGLVLMVMAFIWAGWMAGKGGAFSTPRFKMLVRWLAWGIVAVFVLFAFNVFELRTKITSLHEYYSGVSAETGIAASRTGVWHDAIHTILKYPLLGIRVTGDEEEITSEYASQGGYLSHNVFLDYGRYTGITGMLLLAFFFFRPLVQMWRSGNQILYLPFLLAHFAMFIFWMSLSFQFYKTFWGLWMLMTMTVAPEDAPQAKMSRSSGIASSPVQRSAAVPRLAAGRSKTWR